MTRPSFVHPQWSFAGPSRLRAMRPVADATKPVANETPKPTVKMLADNGMSTRQIADITGWDQRTIQRDLATNVAKRATNDAHQSATGSAETKEHRAGSSLVCYTRWLRKVAGRFLAVTVTVAQPKGERHG
jgi:hypothetical protein